MHTITGINETNLAQTCRENYNLVNFTHLFQKIIHPWALDYVDVVPMILDFNWNNVVGLLDRLEEC
jgi:hypothetical protein